MMHPVRRGYDFVTSVTPPHSPLSVLTQRWRSLAHWLHSVGTVCAQLESWGLAAGKETLVLFSGSLK